MKFPERILRTFEHKSIDKIVWQPRIMYWFNSNKIPLLNEEMYKDVEYFVPREYIGKQIKEIYDDLNASIRYPAETLNIPFFYSSINKEAKIKIKKIKDEDKSTVNILETPLGTLTQKERKGYIIEHYVKKKGDLKIIEYLIKNTSFHFNPLMFEAATEEMQDYGIPTSYYFRSPYMRCVIDFLGFEKTIIFLRRYPKEMESFLKTLDEWDLYQYKKVIATSPVKLLNFGENLDHNFAPPKYFEKYLQEYYEKRLKILHNEGKYAFIHIDGSFENLLPYLPELSFDGYEALTPPPQGDVSVEKIAKTIGDSGKVLFDIIPATLFMKEFPEKRLIEETKRILDLLSPNLILGISDELCMGDGRRLKTISKIVEEFQPY